MESRKRRRLDDAEKRDRKDQEMGKNRVKEEGCKEYIWGCGNMYIRDRTAGIGKRKRARDNEKIYRKGKRTYE